MGMSSKPKSKSTSYSGSSNPAFLPSAKEAIGNIQGVVNQAAPGLQNLTNIAQNQVVPGMLNTYNQGQAGNQAGRQYLSNVVGGNFMQGNPYIDSILSRIRGDVGNQINSQYALGGRYGSDAWGQGLGRGIGDAEGSLLYQNYGDEMARRDAAANSLGQMSAQDSSALLASLGVGAELPYTGIDKLSGALGNIYSGGSDKSTSKGASPIWGAIGAGLSAAGQVAAASDRRMKADIELLRTDPDGLNWYSFRYKSDPDKARYVGVMADEVKQLRPQAYVPNFIGQYAGVNYAALGTGPGTMVPA